MEITRGISIFNCNSNEEHNRIVYQLREEDKNIIFFNVGTPFSIRVYDYFKKKKLKTNNCFLAFIYKIFYRFIPDVKTVKELDNYSDGPNRYFMVVKDLISNKNKKYVLGLTALSYGTIDEIVSYLIKNKAEYKVLLINIEYSLKETVYYPNVTVEQAMSELNSPLVSYVKEQLKHDYNYLYNISDNAAIAFYNDNINELVAEVGVLGDKVTDPNLLNKVKEVLSWK